MVTTRVYRNDSEEDIDIPGLGEIEAGQQVSFTGEFHTPVVISNYPGLVDVLAEEEAQNG
jgi:hypothetical protein